MRNLFFFWRAFDLTVVMYGFRTLYTRAICRAGVLAFFLGVVSQWRGGQQRFCDGRVFSFALRRSGCLEFVLVCESDRVPLPRDAGTRFVVFFVVVSSCESQYAIDDTGAKNLLPIREREFDGLGGLVAAHDLRGEVVLEQW